jgi:hypothetical protein
MHSWSGASEMRSARSANDAPTAGSAVLWRTKRDRHCVKLRFFRVWEADLSKRAAANIPLLSLGSMLELPNPCTQHLQH